MVMLVYWYAPLQHFVLGFVFALGVPFSTRNYSRLTSAADFLKDNLHTYFHFHLHFASISRGKGTTTSEPDSKWSWPSWETNSR